MDMIRAWKDADYRASLSANELRELPEHPAGKASLRSLPDAELDQVAAAGTNAMQSIGCCGPTVSTSLLGTNNAVCFFTCL